MYRVFCANIQLDWRAVFCKMCGTGGTLIHSARSRSNGPCLSFQVSIGTQFAPDTFSYTLLLILIQSRREGIPRTRPRHHPRLRSSRQDSGPSSSHSFRSSRRFAGSIDREAEKGRGACTATTGRRPYRTGHGYDHHRTGRPNSRGKRGG
jgi:hypothetical protein